jgi:RNA polymerase sigma factor (TIGR02999 family)
LLDGGQSEDWKSRGHFFGAAAEAMRRILIENARRRHQPRRGGGLRRVPLDDADAIVNQSEELLALNDALLRLEQRDPPSAELVKLRYFAGLTMPQAAEALGIPLRTAERQWTYAVGR